jgi:hypothetical protein
MRMVSSRFLVAITLSLVSSSSVRAGFWEDFSGRDVDFFRVGNHIFSGGPGLDGIPAMVNPLAVFPHEVEYVADDDLVMGVVINGEAKAYPENLGWWHEIINDEIGGQFISVTLCPLTGTALNFNATDRDGSQIEFGVSGLLINSNLVMYDRRDFETLYPQMIYTGIQGTFRGEQLELLPIIETTWSMWQKMYPDTKVAQGATGLQGYSSSQRDRYSIESYFRYPYGRYRTSQGLLLFPTTTADPDRSVHNYKDTVLGICRDGAVKSYPFTIMPDGAVINDLLGADAIVIVYDAESRTAIPYLSEVGDKYLEFFAVESDGHLPVEFMDTDTNTRWDMLGNAIEGPLKGTRLQQLPAYNSMWFAWDTYWRGADVWDGEGIVEPLFVSTAIEEDPRDATPSGFGLNQNFPNPFNPSTHIQLNLPVGGVVDLAIYDNLGQAVRTLSGDFRAAGIHLFSWDGLDDSGVAVASGTYAYKAEMRSGDDPEAGFSQTRRMTLLR